MTDTLFSTKDAAVYLSKHYGVVAPSTLSKHAQNKTGPKFSYMGNRMIYAKSDLDVWANARTFRKSPKPLRGALPIPNRLTLLAVEVPVSEAVSQYKVIADIDLTPKPRTSQNTNNERINLILSLGVGAGFYIAEDDKDSVWYSIVHRMNTRPECVAKDQTFKFIKSADGKRGVKRLS